MIRNVTKLKFDWNKTKVSVSKIPLTMVQAVVSDAVMGIFGPPKLGLGSVQVLSLNQVRAENQGGVQSMRDAFKWK